MTETKNEYTTIGFYKSDIIASKRREKDNLDICTIAFPKGSKYEGYVWFYPREWMKPSQFNDNKLFVSFVFGNKINIQKSERNKETGSFETVDTKELTVEELKELMKRPYKKSSKFEQR